MALPKELQTHCESKCECAQDDLEAYTVPPKTGNSQDDQIVVCPTYLTQIENPDIGHQSLALPERKYVEPGTFCPGDEHQVIGQPKY